jgi:hypothetical protein
MSTHPNVILMAVLTPDGLSRKTMKDILQANNVTDPDFDVKIVDEDYHHIVMESDYEEGFQVSAGEGDLVFLDMVTYGYGDTIEWGKLVKQKDNLEDWAKRMCDKFNCSYKIIVTANYW